MKKYLILISVLIAVSPSIASAAWWNPISWFSREIPSQIQQVEPATSTQIQIPQVITKTVTVDNPDLQKQIDSLIQENDALKNKLSDESSSLQQIVNQYNNVKTEYDKYTSADNKIVFPLVTSVLNQYVGALNDCKKQLGQAASMIAPTIPFNSTPASFHSINCTSNYIGDTMYTNCR